MKHALLIFKNVFSLKIIYFLAYTWFNEVGFIKNTCFLLNACTLAGINQVS